MTISSFSGKHFFLSNFFPVEIEFEGMVFPSSEHAYMASKSEDQAVRELILAAPTSGKAKKIGQEIVLRPEWDKFWRLHFMRIILEIKFAKGTECRRLLDETKGELLIEGNHWGDTFWGECPLGKGKNNLGKMLMTIRDGLDFD